MDIKEMEIYYVNTLIVNLHNKARFSLLYI